MLFKRLQNINSNSSLRLNDIVQAALSWYKMPNISTNRALRSAIEALLLDRSATIASFLAGEKDAAQVSDKPTAQSAPLYQLAAGTFDVYWDGSALRNPGPSGCGWVATSEGEVVGEGFESIGYTTNQVAEIRAAAYGLNHLP